MEKNIVFEKKRILDAIFRNFIPLCKVRDDTSPWGAFHESSVEERCKVAVYLRGGEKRVNESWCSHDTFAVYPALNRNLYRNRERRLGEEYACADDERPNKEGRDKPVGGSKEGGELPLCLMQW